MAINPNYDYLNMNPGDYVWYQPEQLAPYAQQATGKINLNTEALSRNRAEALRNGPSAWRGMMDKSIQANERQGLNSAAGRSAGQAAEAQSNLAMRGGLSGGARERIARDSSNNYLNMAQDVSNQATQAGYTADQQDEQNRIHQLQAQPGMDIAALQPDMQKAQLNMAANQYDIGNKIGSYDKLNAANIAKYQENMRAWAAGQQAQATQNSGKK